MVLLVKCVQFIQMDELRISSLWVILFTYIGTNKRSDNMKAGSFTIMRPALCAVALSVAMGAWSAENFWRDTTGDHKWGTPGNWSLERCPTDGDTVTILEGMDAISVDNDSAASFASAITITQRTKLPITYVDIEATTNLTLHCVMSSYASFRLKSAIDVSAADTSQLNFQGFNILEKGRFLMPEGGSTRFDYGRFAVSNDAALVARRATNHRLYQLYADGMVTNMNSEKATLTITMASSPISYIAGPLGGKWTVQPEHSLNIFGTNNVAITGSIAPYGGAALGIMKFGMKGSYESSIGNLDLSPDFYGSIVKYLGTGETTDKGYVIAGSTGCEQELDGGETGGLIYNGNFSYKNNASYNAAMQRFVFSGNGTAKTNVFGGAWAALGGGCSTYVTKRGPSIWRFNSNASRNNAGVIAVEEGTLQFESIAEKGTVCSLGTADILHERYSGTYDAGRTNDYAYLLGTTNAAGVSATEGVMEYVGTSRAVSTTRPFRLLGDGRLSSPSGDLQLVGGRPVAGGDRTLTLSAGEGVSRSLDYLDDGDGRVSVVKEGAGTWTIGGASSISGGIDVRGGELRVIGLNAPYEYYRFTVMGTPAGEEGTDTYCYVIQFDELSLFDSEGNRLNPSMTWKHDSHATEGVYPVSGDARELEPGEIFSGRTDAMFFYANDGYGMDYLCNNVAASQQNRCLNYYRARNKAYAPKLLQPETHMPVVMRVAASAIGRAVKYDFLNRWDAATTYTPNSFRIEGSPDGASWTELSRRENYTAPTAANSWYSDGTTFSKTTAPTGFEISPYTTAGVSLAGVTNVSVAAGATLTAMGDVAPISRITVDAAAGAGTISGFSLAESGTLVIANEPAGASSYYVSLDISGCTDAANISGWTLMVDGVDMSDTRTVKVAGGRIRIGRGGFIFFVR